MLCRPRSSCRLLRRLRRPQLPLRSSIGGLGGVRGRKVPPRRPSVLLDRHHPHSASVLCEHPAASRTSGAGSRSLRKPGSRRCRERRTAIRASEPSRLSPVRPSVHPSRPVSSAPLLRPDGLRSIPLQSPAAPTTPDRLPGHAPLRSASYGTARLLAATRNPLAHSPGD